MDALREPRASRQKGSSVTSDEILQSAFDHSPIGMSVADLDGRWLRINPAYCRMLGYAAEELLGATFRDFTHPDDVRADAEFVAAALTGKLDILEHEKRYVR